MKFFASIWCVLLLATTVSVAQVPTPQATTTIQGPSWLKTNATDFTLKDKNGKTLSNVKDLLYLETETLAVLDRNNRIVYLLEDFKNAASGASGSAKVLATNLGSTFYITNPNSFGHYVDDNFKSGVFCNIGGSYIYYLAEEDATFLLEDIRKFSDWGAGSSVRLPYTSSHMYWYRDAAQGEFGVIEKGKTLDYSRVTSEKSGNDLIVKWDGTRKYILPGYYTTASFVYKPVQMYSGTTTSTSTVSSNCVQGDCKNGWGKFEYDGGHYDGFWKNGRKHGYGLYKWEGTGKYIGNWDNDKMSGYGVYIAENEDNIIGEYNNGNLNGLGITVTGNKWEQGVFVDGNLVTPYPFVSTGQTTGCTAGDCQNKYGRFKWENGDQFTGFFKNGNLHMGTYNFKDGGKYSGMFNSNSQFHGTGRYFFADKAYYGGEWNNGKYHGRGYYHNASLEQQVGEWSNGTLTKRMK
ncbi:MAG: hypothetical protein HKO54_07350 [Flavobacteriaceae bacterium]|nr:hypothetical protein [Flavobacteriaceae bacterium]